MNLTEENYKLDLFSLVSSAPNGKNYNDLLNELYSIDFIPIIERDENRAIDGLDLRENLGFFSNRPCSVLEMLISLSGRFEGNSGFDKSQVRFNFWLLIEHLTLNRFDDSRFNLRVVREIIDRFLKRKFTYDGFGGLFPLKHPKKDQRNVEIWDQMQAWEIENFGI